MSPLDYHVWSVVDKVADEARLLNIRSLPTAVEAAFTDMDRALLKRACARMRRLSRPAEDILCSFALEISFYLCLKEFPSPSVFCVNKSILKKKV